MLWLRKCDFILSALTRLLPPLSRHLAYGYGTCLIAAPAPGLNVHTLSYRYVHMAQVCIFMTFCFCSTHGLEHFVLVIFSYRRVVGGKPGKTVAGRGEILVKQTKTCKWNM